MTREFIRVEKTGDWMKFRDTLRKMETELIPTVQDAIYDELNEAKEQLKFMIENQSLPLEPLSTKYQQYKSQHGLDPRILISTGEYIDSFTVTRVGNRTWILHPQGVSAKGVPMEQLGTMLEHGTADMPARPHWLFINETLRQDVVKRIQKDIKGTLTL
jgi:hypothetical protein